MIEFADACFSLEFKNFMRKSHWLMPPLLGAAAFVTMRGVDRAEINDTGTPVVQAKREDPTRAGVAQALASLDQELEEQRRAGELDLATMDADDLKLQILALKQRMDGFDQETPWDRVESVQFKIRRAACELGKRLKQEGLDWVLEKCPDSARSAMDGIAEVDPSLAFGLVVASERSNPCFRETLMKLLQHQAEQGPTALGRACTEVPWELFYARDDPFESGFEIPEEADMTAWIQSGAALELAKNGVELTNFFERWATLDPAQALSAWEDWPDNEVNSSTFRVTAILLAGLTSNELASRITAGLQQLPTAELEKLEVKLGAYKKINGPAASELETLYSILVPTKGEVQE